MSYEEDGGPAFPSETLKEFIHGMTLRDYFAAAALTGFLASDRRSTSDEDVISESAYKLSDAMLEARNK